MLNTNYAKLVGEYPEYLRMPVELKSQLIINGVTHTHRDGNFRNKKPHGSLLTQK